MKPRDSSDSFPKLLQQFFLERLMEQRNVSPQTVAAYRDSFRLLLQFAQDHCIRQSNHIFPGGTSI